MASPPEVREVGLQVQESLSEHQEGPDIVLNIGWLSSVSS